MTDAPKQSSELIDLAHRHFRLVHATSGDVHAVPKVGPNVARPLRGARSTRAALARLYHERAGKAPSTSALVEALTVLEGQAQELPTEELALRYHYGDGRLVCDLGTPAGEVVIVTSDGWSVAPYSEDVTFRRTKLTAPLPVPECGGSLDELGDHVNVTTASWPLVRGFLVAACFPDQACPVLGFIAEQGSGKTTSAARLAMLIDPSPAPLRHAPANPLDWTVMAHASRLVGLDNVSSLAPWLSDALCRAVTGEGFVARELYTDDDVTVFSGRRAIVLTAIDAGRLVGDFADRLVTVELGPIRSSGRREDADLDAAFDVAYPRLLGALYDEIVGVLGRRPQIRPAELPRMADYGRILATLDDLHGSHGLSTYLETRSRLAADVVDSDPVAAAIRDLARRDGTWDGTAGELLDAITPEPPPKGWPRSASHLSGRLRRIAPALRSLGIDATDGRSNGRRWVRLTSDGSRSSGGTVASLFDPLASLPPGHNGAGHTPNSDARDASDAESPTPSVPHQEEGG